MTKRLSLITACIAAFSLSGCGTESRGPSAQVVQSLKSLAQFGPKAPPPGPDDLLTRDEINQVTVPYAMVGIERRGAYATMTLAGQNGGYNSWITGDGAGMVLLGGVLTGTKGLGADLVTADVPGLAVSIASGIGMTNRVHQYLDGEGRIYSISYTCSVARDSDETITIVGKTYATRVVTESCVSDLESFENTYWIGKSDGVMWQSRQWVSSGVGHVLLLSLVPVAR